MAKIVKIRLSEFYPFQGGLSKKDREMEAGVTDHLGNPLYSLEDYIEGNAPFVSLACDYLGGPPGYVKEFRIYGYRVWIPKISADINSFIDSPIVVPIMIDFRLVDTGGRFFGKKKQVKTAGHEPIDVCRRAKPAAAKSFSDVLTELLLIGKP